MYRIKLFYIILQEVFEIMAKSGLFDLTGRVAVITGASSD